MLDKEQIKTLYRKMAKRYNFTANLYYLIGFREYAYRKKAVGALQLKKGDMIVEICCGTGINFSLFQQAVGVEGKIIGVDLTDAMLAMAKSRIEENKWKNVELVHSDAVLFQFPQNIDGIISTFALTLVPEFDTVIRNGCRSLKKGGRYAAMLAEGIAVIIIIFGIVGALGIYAKKTFFIRADYHAMVRSRSHLGHSLSLALEFLIGADILRTAISPTWQDIGLLAAIVGIRTVLNFFLSKELKQTDAMQ